MQVIRKLAGYALAAFAVYYAITNPTETAHAIHAIASGIGSFAAALVHGGK